MTRHIRLTLLAFAAMLAAFTASSQDNIVQRLNDPQSAISVNAPEALLQRAEPAEQTETEHPENGNEEASAEQQEDKIVRAKGGKTVGYRVQVYADNNVSVPYRRHSRSMPPTCRMHRPTGDCVWAISVHNTMPKKRLPKYARHFRAMHAKCALSATG